MPESVPRSRCWSLEGECHSAAWAAFKASLAETSLPGFGSWPSPPDTLLRAKLQVWMTLGGPGDAGGMLVPSACHFSHLQPLLCTLSGICGERLCRPWGYPDQPSLCLRLNTIPGLR